MTFHDVRMRGFEKRARLKTVLDWLDALIDNLPSETIYNQIDYVSEQTVNDARQLLVTACGRRLSQEQVLEEEPELEGINKVRGNTKPTNKKPAATKDDSFHPQLKGWKARNCTWSVTNGIVTICHGRSTAPAICNAIRVAHRAVGANVNQHIVSMAREASTAT